jgi:hypothetical protein
LRWAAAVALGLAGLIGVGATTVPAAPAAGKKASEFEVAVQSDCRFAGEIEFAGCLVDETYQERFRSRAPVCAKGTVEDVEGGGVGGKLKARRFTCDDGTGQPDRLGADHHVADPGRERRVRRPPG